MQRNHNRNQTNGDPMSTETNEIEQRLNAVLSGEPAPVKAVTALDAALKLLKKGLSLLPVPYRSKKPKHSWKRFQAERPTEDEVKAWFANGPSNYGIVTGALSRIAVIDCDSPEAAAYVEKKYPTSWIQTTSRGKQFLFRHPGGKVPTVAGLTLDAFKIDVRGDGGFIVGPNSVHPSGAVYTTNEPGWGGTPDDLPVFPMEIFAAESRLADKLPHATAPSASLEELRDLLSRKDPNCGYDEWIRAGMSVHHESGGSEEGFALWNEWSARSPEKYKGSEDLRSHWRSFGKSDNPVTIDSLRRTDTATPDEFLAGKSAAERVSFTSAAEIEPQRIEWLWKPRIPIGNITMLDGDPGIGKSFITVRIAADVSRGRDGFSQGNVLWLSAEDGKADTIKPRLMAADADCGRIFIADQPFTLDDTGTELLRGQIADKHPLLVIIDPIFAYVGGETNTNADNEIRQILSPLKAIADKYRTAILCVRHLNKTGKEKAIYRGSGSMGITGAARSVLLAGYSVQDKSELAVVHIKCNIAEKAPPLGYKIVPYTADGIETARLEWTGNSEVQAEDILGSEFNAVPEKPSAVREAEDFLLRELRTGPRAFKALEIDARKWEISKRTLTRAKAMLGVESFKDGKKGWMWALPAEPLEGGQTDKTKSTSLGEQCQAF
jgi:hypothetical protein